MITPAPAADSDLLRRQLQALLDGESDALANVSNFIAFLNDNLQQINWVGMYIRREDELVLGPFQGKPACSRIPMGHGVCGTAARDRQIVRVADVEQFAGHISCDSASRSEVVLPVIVHGEVIGVLDIDSPVISRFDEEDERVLGDLLAAFIESTGAALTSL